jgi:2EXR family
MNNQTYFPHVGPVKCQTPTSIVSSLSLGASYRSPGRLDNGSSSLTAPTGRSRADPIDLTEEDDELIIHAEHGPDSSTGRVVDLADGFVFFPKLPPELHCKIWHYALPGPRYVEIRSKDTFWWNGNPTYSSILWKPLCVESTPSIFWACHEAKAEVCKTYKPFRGNESGSKVAWCDFSQDYMCFSYLRFTMMLESSSTSFRETSGVR